MRITVGGLLLFAGAGGLTAVGPLKTMAPTAVTEQVSGFKQSISWVTGYFKSGQPIETAPIDLPVAESSPSAISVISESEPAAPVAETPAVPEPAPAPAVVEQPAPALKAVAPRRRRASRRRKAVPAVAAAGAAKAKPASTDSMVGMYVALQLKSGREVKGVFKEKTATQVTIELPGMGPFSYPTNNVLGIKPVE